jgi:L-asparaginase II
MTPPFPSPVVLNPVVVEVTRGDMVESVHRAAIAVVAADGAVELSCGDIEHPVYPRSAIKPLQALPLLETGAADAFGLSDVEIALACASHSAEPRHVAAVAAWLKRIGCNQEDLECGGHAPMDAAAANALTAGGVRPSALHNNCSGKHTGFLSGARHMGEPTAGYIGYDHPVQRRVRAALAEMCGVDVAQAPVGIDGCGIPQYGMPLRAIALGMARLAAPGRLLPARKAAIERVRRAMAAEPFLVAGTDRFDTAVMTATEGKILVKGGAEGVYAAILPDRRLGVALKIDDGAKRAAEAAAGHVLRRLGAIPEAAATRLASYLRPNVHNVVGRLVGEVRPAAACPV